ncbi:terpene synthase family protein [Chitinophaga ginsengisegetis]|uniref:terpene synthase family protein n=1 Tax=Chitinophaga ginsengisegetis TaxID=393003 RepID=UPI001D03D1AB|nr:terpene synthase family protein [Chitinophaga ginsengisegetis]
MSDMKGFFHTMITATAYSYKTPVHYPLLSDYLVIREDLIGVYPTADLAEITGTTLLTNEVLENPVIKQLRKLTSLIVALSNDIFSVRKDEEEKEAMNAVLIIQHEQQCTLDSAYAETVRLHNEFTAEFVHTCNHLPHFGQQDKTVRRYIENLSHIIQGHLSWYQYSARY